MTPTNRTTVLAPSEVQEMLREVWVLGEVADLPTGENYERWKRLADNLADELGVVFESHESGFFRANRGFPLGVTPFSSEAQHWLSTVPERQEQREFWNNLLEAGRGIA